MSAAIERLVGRILSYFLISASYDAFGFRWFLLESLSQGYGESTNTEYRNKDLLPSAVGVLPSECGDGTERMTGERRENEKAIGERGHILQQRDGVRFGTCQRGPGTYRTGENPAGKGRLFFEWVRKFPDSVDRKGLRGHLSEKLIQKIKPINILLYIG